MNECMYVCIYHLAGSCRDCWIFHHWTISLFEDMEKIRGCRYVMPGRYVCVYASVHADVSSGVCLDLVKILGGLMLRES